MADMKSFISCIWFAQKKDYKKVVVLFTDPTSSMRYLDISWNEIVGEKLGKAKLQCIHSISSDASNNWDISSPARLRTVLTPCRARPGRMSMYAMHGSGQVQPPSHLRAS